MVPAIFSDSKNSPAKLLAAVSAFLYAAFTAAVCAECGEEMNLPGLMDQNAQEIPSPPFLSEAVSKTMIWIPPVYSPYSIALTSLHVQDSS